MSKMLYCPFCGDEIAGGGIEHVLNDCPNATEANREMARRARRDVLGAFGAVLSNPDGTKRDWRRRETPEQKAAREFIAPYWTEPDDDEGGLAQEIGRRERASR